MNLPYLNPAPVTSRLPLKHDLEDKPESSVDRKSVE
jgi:hypothetical protein